MHSVVIAIVDMSVRPSVCLTRAGIGTMTDGSEIPTANLGFRLRRARESCLQAIAITTDNQISSGNMSAETGNTDIYLWKCVRQYRNSTGKSMFSTTARWEKPFAGE